MTTFSELSISKTLTSIHFVKTKFLHQKYYSYFQIRLTITISVNIKIRIMTKLFYS